MNDERSFERTARAWLELGANQAPDRAVQAVLLAIESTPQERDLRIPWRFPSMNGNVFKLAAAAVIAVLVVVGGLAFLGGRQGDIGAPTSTASPSASSVTPRATPISITAADLSATFTSPLHGYTVRYPGSWTGTPATEAWPCCIRNSWGSGINDELTLAGVARFSGASQQLAAGQTAEGWVSAATGYPDPSSMPTIDVGGHQGFIDADGVDADAVATSPGTVAPGGVMYDVVVVVDGRGYNFNMDGLVDRASFEAMLASVTFDPPAAISATPFPTP